MLAPLAGLAAAAALLTGCGGAGEEPAEARGPAEMSLEVECGDGVDTNTQDYGAECIAYADEGMEHLRTVTVGPADAGMEVEVANEG